MSVAWRIILLRGSTRS